MYQEMHEARTCVTFTAHGVSCLVSKKHWDKLWVQFWCKKVSDVKVTCRALCRIELLPHTCDTIYTHFQGITNNIYGFGSPFLLLHFFTCSPIFLHVHNGFYLSKWWVVGSLHKAMLLLLHNINRCARGFCNVKQCSRFI